MAGGLAVLALLLSADALVNTQSIFEAGVACVVWAVAFTVALKGGE
jgi:hypothetical protein